MAYRFGTSFDWIANGQFVSGVFDSVVFAGANKSGDFMQVNNGSSVNKVFDNQQVWIFGARFKPGDIGAGLNVGGTIIVWYDAATVQCSILMQNIGGAVRVSAWRGNPNSGGVQIGSSSTATFIANSSAEYDIEIKCTIANAGNVTIKFDNVEVLNVNGDFAASANEFANILHIGPEFLQVANIFQFYKWVYVLDSTGALCNDFIGPQLCTTLRPTANGATIQWTPNAGQNFDRVDDVTADGDTTINSSTTVNQIDTFTASDLPADVVTVNAVSQWQVARRGDADTIGIAQVLRLSGTDYLGAEDVMAPAFLYYENAMDDDPNNVGNRFTKAVLDAAEIGYKLTTA